MTKHDIVERVAAGTGLTKKEAFDLVETLFEVMKDTLVSREELKISRFGKFVVRQKENRRGRNPQTGEELLIEPHKVLSFKASAMLKGCINGT